MSGAPPPEQERPGSTTSDGGSAKRRFRGGRVADLPPGAVPATIPENASPEDLPGVPIPTPTDDKEAAAAANFQRQASMASLRTGTPDSAAAMAGIPTSQLPAGFQMPSASGTEDESKLGSVAAQSMSSTATDLYDPEKERKKLQKESMLKDALFVNEEGMTVLPDAREILRQRHFTLEGFTLEEQTDEIRRIRRRGKNEVQKSQNLNRAFRRNVGEVGILRHAAVKFGVLPLDFERELELNQISKGGMFEMVDAKGLQTNVLNVDAPEWVKALLELSGLTGIRDYIREDRMRRKEPDYVHAFPDVYKLVSSLDFEILGSTLILVNAGFLSWQISQFDRFANEEMFDALEKFFTLLFFAEFLLRCVAYGWTMIFEPFNGFDAFLVVGCGFLPQFVLPLLGVEVDKSGLRTFTALRTIRVIRVAKAVRLKPGFKEMWELVNGFASSMLVTAWTLVILIVFVYCFAVLGIKLLQQDSFEQPHHDIELKNLLFGDVMDGMLSMFQVVTLDGFSDGIVRKITFSNIDGSGDSDFQILYTRIFFAVFVVVANMVVLNTIMAMVVEKTFYLSKVDEEVQAREAQEKKERELMILTEMFLDIDVDRSGDLTKREFYAALDFNEYIRDRLSELDMAPEYLKETWDILDDGDGKLTVFEFTSGIRNLKGDARSKDVMDAQKRLESCKSFVDEVLESKIIKLDRVFHILTKDMRELRDDVELVALSTTNLAKMVRAFYDQARVKAAERRLTIEAEERERKKQEEEDRKAAEMKAKALVNVKKERQEHLQDFDPRRKPLT
ncbi:unnamed protein product [Amoebophrya sp. A25]|nr:unnamed protein product [Amoebophrya sp. A25]|eukprot:GSA25T00011003001.1